MNEWLRALLRAVSPGAERSRAGPDRRHASASACPTPKRQHPDHPGDRARSIHLDIAWPEVRLAVEPGHSWWHGGELRQLRDEARDRACGVVGWHVIRFGEDVRGDLAAAHASVLASSTVAAQPTLRFLVGCRIAERSDHRRQNGLSLVTARVAGMTVRVGINGFGRIGRNLFRAAIERGADIDFVAVNDLGSVDTMAHLLKYDSILGILPAGRSRRPRAASRSATTCSRCSRSATPPSCRGPTSASTSSSSRPASSPPASKAAVHLDAGAPLVVVSAPSAGADGTFVMGVNHTDFDPKVHKVVSNASCTTNCFVPMVKVLDDAFGVEQGLMTTIHAYTGDQMLVDGPHTDLRRARGAAINIVPTSTGAARATSLVLESMKGKLDGTSLRVPVPTGSITDFNAILAKPATVAEINAAFAKAARSGPLKGIIRYCEDPIVSSDIQSDPHSCIFDSDLTMSMGTLVKVLGWYDNEWGYSNRMVDFMLYAGKKMRLATLARQEVTRRCTRRPHARGPRGAPRVARRQADPRAHRLQRPARARRRHRAHHRRLPHPRRPADDRVADRARRARS